MIHDQTDDTVCSVLQCGGLLHPMFSDAIWTDYYYTQMIKWFKKYGKFYELASPLVKFKNIFFSARLVYVQSSWHHDAQGQWEHKEGDKQYIIYSPRGLVWVALWAACWTCEAHVSLCSRSGTPNWIISDGLNFTYTFYTSEIRNFCNLLQHGLQRCITGCCYSGVWHCMLVLQPEQQINFTAAQLQWELGEGIEWCGQENKIIAGQTWVWFCCSGSSSSICHCNCSLRCTTAGLAASGCRNF